MWKLSQWWQLSAKREMTSMSSWEISVGFNCRFWSYWLVVVCTLTDYCGCTSWLRYAFRVFLEPFYPSLSPLPFQLPLPLSCHKGAGAPHKNGDVWWRDSDCFCTLTFFLANPDLLWSHCFSLSCQLCLDHIRICVYVRSVISRILNQVHTSEAQVCQSILCSSLATLQ